MLSDSWFQGFSNELENKDRRGRGRGAQELELCVLFCSVYAGEHIYVSISSFSCFLRPSLSLFGAFNVKRVKKKKKKVETKYRSWFVPLNNYGRCIHTAFRSISIFSYRRQENAQIRSKRM